jgi:hypothetical protein
MLACQSPRRWEPESLPDSAGQLSSKPLASRVALVMQTKDADLTRGARERIIDSVAFRKNYLKGRIKTMAKWVRAA